jgi:hypothetical protein
MSKVCGEYEKRIEELKGDIKELRWALSTMITISERPVEPPDHICGSPCSRCDMLCEDYARQESLRVDCKRIQKKYETVGAEISTVIETAYKERDWLPKSEVQE